LSTSGDADLGPYKAAKSRDIDEPTLLQAGDIVYLSANHFSDSEAQKSSANQPSNFLHVRLIFLCDATHSPYM
jgi:hypothetical protein